MRAKLFGVLSRFELDGRWECRGDGVGDVWRDGEVDEGRREYLKKKWSYRDEQCKIE